MTGQNNTSGLIGADRRKKVGLGLLGVEDQFGFNDKGGKVVLDKVNELEVGFAAGGIESDEAADDLARRVGWPLFTHVKSARSRRCT